jgi:hypothetical protein
LVKIELDDRFKIQYPLDGYQNKENCCLERDPDSGTIPVSLYHFFRHVKVIGKLGADQTVHSDETQINVRFAG